MTNVFRFVQALVLGVWLGAIIYLSFVVAPGVFATLASRDQAGAVVGLILGRLHQLGVIAAIIYLIAALPLGGSLKALFRPATLCVMAMLALTLASQYIVTPRMAALRAGMVSVDATPRTGPLRVEFDRLHRAAVHLEGGVLLVGLVALYLTVRTRPQP